MIAALRKALDEQYAAFTTLRPRVVEGCPCCSTPAQLARLVAVPREHLEAKDLDHYARKAITTIGGSAQFRYFWPRVAELSLARELETDPEVVFGKPRYGGHAGWPLSERDAILRLAAGIGEWLAESALEGEVDSWVCVVGLLAEGIGDPVALLDPLVSGTPAAAANLREFLEHNDAGMIAKQRLSNTFWENASDSATQILDWLRTDERIARMRLSMAKRSHELYGTT
jgi:hypothetical protein